MAHKIKDDEQEYQYTSGFTTPSGHEFHYYDTPNNQRLVLKHASGSHIEFKADGSIIVKSLKDLHMHSSIVSNAAPNDDNGEGADRTTQKVDTNYTLEVAGELNIKCANLNIECGETMKTYAGTDMTFTSNNEIHKSTETINLQAAKSIYQDAAELKTRAVTTRSEIGTKEGPGGAAPMGGENIINVHGNAVIQNNDINGGITISSKGYLNLVCGTERVDVTGQWTPMPSTMGKATYTHMVMPGKGALDVSPMPGDGFVSYTTNYTEAVGMNRIRGVAMNEAVTIGGIQTIKATKIFLN